LAAGREALVDVATHYLMCEREGVPRAFGRRQAAARFFRPAERDRHKSRDRPTHPLLFRRVRLATV